MRMNRIKAVISVLLIFTFSVNCMLPTFEEIQRKFKKEKMNCLHSLVTLNECDEELIKSDSHIKEFADKLNDLVFEETVNTHYFNLNKQEGYTSYNLIKSGCISGIFCNFDHAKKLAYVDIYSSKIYNPHLALWFSSNWFKSGKRDLIIIDRR